MNERFESYLDSIGLSASILKECVERTYKYSSKLCPEKIEDLFVNDFIKEDKSREYSSLWFFSKCYLMEVRNFRNANEYDIDIARIADWLSYYRISFKDYDLVESSETSSMKVECSNSDGIGFVLQASRENCNKLTSIIETYLKASI